MMSVMHALASHIFRGLFDASTACEMPSPRSTNWNPLAGHAIQIFSESRDSITSLESSRPRHICNAYQGLQILLRLHLVLRRNCLRGCGQNRGRRRDLGQLVVSGERHFFWVFLIGSADGRTIEVLEGVKVHAGGAS